MNISTAMYKYLSTYADLTALVSTRIYPLMLPQQIQQPAVLLFEESNEPVPAFQDDTALYESVFTVSAFGRTKTQAVNTVLQLRAALQDYSGTMGGVGGVVVQTITQGAITESYDDITESFVKEFDIEIWHN